jgi:DNA-binding response OmpR family regulator
MEPDNLPDSMGLPSTSANHILFVDDDRATRDGYSAYLETCGYAVMTASSGADVMASALEWDPVVIVLDLGLKDVDGWEVARRLKADPRTAAVPIIAFTGADLPHERISAMRAGCDRYLVKPSAPSALVDQIERCLRDPE